VRLPRTAAFDEESARFQLRFCCEDCGHFDARFDRCAHEWPSEAHRRAAADPGNQEPQLDFCKEFELC
jgi:hypothetical protein